jgi:hypothetical protein
MNTTSTCPYATPQSSYNWSSLNPFVPAKASAQAATLYVDQNTNTYNPELEQSIFGGDVLPVPMLIILFMFILFVIIMSVVYVYHWTKFSLGDGFIKNATVLYFVGLLLLSAPLILFII